MISLRSISIAPSVFYLGEVSVIFSQIFGDPVELQICDTPENEKNPTRSDLSVIQCSDSTELSLAIYNVTAIVNCYLCSLLLSHPSVKVPDNNTKISNSSFVRVYQSSSVLFDAYLGFNREPREIEDF